MSVSVVQIWLPGANMNGWVGFSRSRLMKIYYLPMFSSTLEILTMLVLSTDSVTVIFVSVDLVSV